VLVKLYSIFYFMPVNQWNNGEKQNFLFSLSTPTGYS
jgi:hypothetical protein